MFVVDAAILLPHPPLAVVRVVERLHTLPRWCAGLRRVRYLAADPNAAPDRGAAATCVFTYSAADVRLTLLAHTRDRAPDAPATVVEHSAAGDGLTLTWTLAAEPEPADSSGRPAGAAAGAPLTRLRARIAVAIDADHPTAASRAALCRVVARRAPADLERLRALLERYEAGRHAAAGPGAPGAPMPDAPVPGVDLARRRPAW